jgi:chitodextrinase
MNAHGSGKDELVWFSPDDPFGWHTWGFLWTQNDLVWYVDGVERKRIRNYINKPMYWLISPEIGGYWAGSTDSSTLWPMEAEVDYVRVYKVGAFDATAPSVPTEVAAVAISSAQIDLSWVASTDNVGVTRYDLYRDDVLHATTEGIFFSDTALAGGTAYNYHVRACDAAENCSDLSTGVSATTHDGDPVPPPSGDDSLQIMALNLTTAGTCYYEVTWTTNQPADSLVEYGTAPGAMDQSVSKITPTTQHRLRLAGLSRKTLYYFRAVSVSGSGEVAASAVGTFKSHPRTTC